MCTPELQHMYSKTLYNTSIVSDLPVLVQLHKWKIIHTHTYTHTYIHTYIHVCIHTYVHTYMHTHKHNIIYMHIQPDSSYINYQCYIMQYGDGTHNSSTLPVNDTVTQHEIIPLVMMMSYY